MDSNFLAVKDRQSGKKNKRRNSKKEDVKVVYISSPIKVETCASKFRALVQELTGKDSDIADSHFGDYLPDSVSGRRSDDDFPATIQSFGETEDGSSPSFSDDLHQHHLQPLDQMEDSFMEMMMSSSLFNEHYGLST